jgi:hypothetical protein
MKKFIATFWNWTWCIIQNLIGIILFCIMYLIDNKIQSKEKGTAFIFKSDKFSGGISLGSFIFVQDFGSEQEITESHEFGHYLQSLLLGPLYLIVIAIPSIVWAILKTIGLFPKKNYYSFYTEKWADKNGKVVRT